jgi:hypothetical protein
MNLLQIGLSTKYHSVVFEVCGLGIIQYIGIAFAYEFGAAANLVTHIRYD